MSKPLCFVLQLIGLFVIVSAMLEVEGVDWSQMVWGIGLAVIGGAGYRERWKRDANAKS